MDENKVMNNQCEEFAPLGEKCHLSYEDLLNDMTQEFNMLDLYEYRNLLMIIKDELFLKENSSQGNKYKIFSILDTIEKAMNDEKNNLPQVDINSFCQEEQQRSVDELYGIFCSTRLQNEEPFLIVNTPEHYTLKGCN